MVINKKTLQIIKKETIPTPIYQEKTITPQNQTHEITADSGYDALSKVILNGLLVDPHQSYTTQTDDTIAYQKTVPSGALKYASLDVLGGMSYKTTNLFDNILITSGKFLDSSGVEQSASNWNIYSFKAKPNTTYTSSGIVSASSSAYWWAYNGTTPISYVETYGNHTFITPANTTIVYCSIRQNENDNIMVNEGSTALPYEPYFTGLRSAKVSEIKVSGSGQTDIVKQIPSVIYNNEYYGLGLSSSLYNALKLDTKVLNKKLGIVNLGTLTWTPNGNTPNAFDSSGISTVVKRPAYGNVKANILCAIYSTETSSGLAQVDKGIAVGTGGTLYVHDTAYSSADVFTTAMNGVYLVYELATEDDIDVSSYLDDDFNYLNVENMTNIEFMNTYNQAVPSKVTYLVEV